MPYDLFISYSRRDNAQGRITQLVERIKTDFANFEGNNGRELVPFFDQQEIAGMQDWRQRILQGLRESRLLFACLSPAYLQSEYCQWEFVEYLKYEIGHLHGFNGVAPIYFVEVPGWDSKDFEQQCAAWIAELRKRQHFDLRPWHDLGEEALREAAVQERMGKLNRQIVQTITRGERAEKSLGNVDAHNPHFIGRTANLRMLRENFVKPGHIGVVTAVNGVAGLGKTALAIEYAHAFADEYGGGRWQVRCAGKDDLRLALAELATPIGFEFTDDEKKNADLQFERTRRELKKLADACAPHRCLLLLDNVDRPDLLDPAQVARLNSGNWLHVLATTRLGENELNGAHRDRSFLAIDELPPDDALALIESYQPDGRFRSDAERDATREIVRLLGSFTLAVESSAVYLGQFANDVTCAAFLARLKKEGLEGLDTAASQSSESVLHGEKRLSATLQPTLERLSAPEKLTLEFAALLPPDQVPLPWLRALVAKTFPELERDAEPGYPDPWLNVLRRLFSLRLIQQTNLKDQDVRKPTCVRMHRLLRDLIQHTNPQAIGRHFQEVLSYVFSRADEFCKKQPGPQDHWEILILTDFVSLCLNAEGGGASFADAMMFFVSRVGEALRLIGFHGEGLALSKKALNKFRDTDAKTGDGLLTALSNQAWALVELSRYNEAESMMKEALALLDKTEGVTVTQRAATQGNYGHLLVMLGRFKEAQEVARQVYDLVKAEYGETHPETANRSVSLAQVLDNLGRHSEAESIVRKAAKVLDDSLGDRAPLTLRALHEHASILGHVGRYDEAEQLLIRVLKIEEETLGDDHPNVADDLSALAVLFQNTDRHDEAELLLRRALEIRIHKFGLLHRSVSITLNNLTGSYVTANSPEDLEDCESLLRLALEIAEKTLGPNHPDVATRLGNLAGVLNERGQLQAAIEAQMRAVEILYKCSSPPNGIHPNLKTHLEALAGLLLKAGSSAKKITRDMNNLIEPLGIRLEIDEKSLLNSVASNKRKIGQNSLCACGSGRKFKKCCGR